MKKRDLKNAYGEAPQSFHNTIVRTLNSLEESGVKAEENGNYVHDIFGDSEDFQVLTVQPKKRSILRTAAAFALVLAIGTGGFVSARAIYPIIANGSGQSGGLTGGQLDTNATADQTESEGSTAKIQEERVGEYSTLKTTGKGQGSVETREMKMILPQAENAPEYVRMDIGYLPDGVVENSENEPKYSFNGEREQMCLTIVSYRVIDIWEFYVEDVIDCDEVESNGKMALLANIAADEYSRRFYIFFEDMATFVEGYVMNDVPEDELEKVISSITVGECLEEDSNASSLTNARIVDEAEKEEENFNEVFYEVPVGRKITYDKDTEYSSVDYTIKNIEILDNISGLDYNNFENRILHIDEIVDEDGNFIPHERPYYSDYYSDDNTVLKTETAAQCLIYLTIEFNNASGQEQMFPLYGFGKIRAKSENGSILLYRDSHYAEVPEPYSEMVNYCDNVFIDEDGHDISMYNLDLPPHSSKTVHIGFLEDKDQLEDMYILLVGDSSTGNFYNFAPERSMFINAFDDNDYVSYGCTKVK